MFNDLMDYLVSPLSEEELKKFKEIRKKQYLFNMIVIYPAVILITLGFFAFLFLMGRLSTLWF